MITEQDLQAAIAECKGKRNPDSGTCLKLAAFYVIKDHLFPNNSDNERNFDNYEYSLDQAPPDVINYTSDTEFSNVINGRNIYDILEIIDDAMTALKVLNPRFYASIIRKIEY